jgi:hypothetical protein
MLGFGISALRCRCAIRSEKIGAAAEEPVGVKSESWPRLKPLQDDPFGARAFSIAKKMFPWKAAATRNHRRSLEPGARSDPSSLPASVPSHL